MFQPIMKPVSCRHCNEIFQESTKGFFWRGLNCCGIDLVFRQGHIFNHAQNLQQAWVKYTPFCFTRINFYKLLAGQSPASRVSDCSGYFFGAVDYGTKKFERKARPARETPSHTLYFWQVLFWLFASRVHHFILYANGFVVNGIE